MNTERQQNTSRTKRRSMLSGTIVLECESTARFLELLATLHEEFQPQTSFEESLIENMAVARWRQLRIWGMEKAGMDYEMRRQAEMSNSDEDDATRASIVFRTLSDDSRSLELINRYDSRYERQYYRAHRRFIEVRDHRSPPVTQTFESPAPTPNAPEAATEEVLLPNEPELVVSEKVNVNERTPEVIANTPASHPSTCGYQPRFSFAARNSTPPTLRRRPRERYIIASQPLLKTNV